MSIIEERAAGNFADVLEHGPRLSFNRSTWVVKRGDGEMLLGGLGCLGVGQMWVTDDGTEHGGDPTYADAPYEPRPAAERGSPLGELLGRRWVP